MFASAKQCVCCVFALALLSSARGGSFFSDFNSGIPVGSRVMGDAQVSESGGVGSSGVLKLTMARRNQQGSFVVGPLDGENPVHGFTAKFKVLIGGGTGADGFSFCFGWPLPENSFAERGFGEGLVVTFDTYKPGKHGNPDISVRAHGHTLLTHEYPGLRTQRFVDVIARLDPKGTFELGFDGDVICSNLNVGKFQMLSGFGFGARTVTYTDNHFIDDLEITTETMVPSFVTAFQPSNDNASPSAVIEIDVHHLKPELNTASVLFTLDEKVVVPVVEKVTYGSSRISYAVPDLMEPGSVHNVSLSFVDDSPLRTTNSFSFAFKVSNQVAITRPQSPLVK